MEEIMNSQTTIFDHWPMKGKEPRKSQTHVLEWIEALPKNIKYILCQIPVGGGKSPIGLTLSGHLAQSIGNSFILTPQKILQTQYQNSFTKEQLFSLFGKSNYTCKPKNTNCDIGSELKPMCNDCPHKKAMGAARLAPNTVLNYHLALLLFALANEISLKKRNLIVFDECHTLENYLTEFNSFQIGEKRCRQFNVNWQQPYNEEDAIDWINSTYLPAVFEEKKKLEDIAEDIRSRYTMGEQMDKADADILTKAKDVSEHYLKVNYFTLNTIDYIKTHYVLVKDKKSFKFKELYGKEVFKQLCEPMADRFLFMSSTILDKDSYCADLGIPPEEAAFISVDSEFNLDNRPVFYLPQMKMTYGWNSDEKKSQRTKMIDAIIQISKVHENDSGIIHTGSFQISNWLVNQLQGKVKHRIMHHNPSQDGENRQSRDTVINEFITDDSEPKLLISPSITEGLDLKDDLARFSIVCKVPYPYLGDAWVKRRQEISREWYMRQAMISIIQSTGRVVRSKEDWGYSYILDESFLGLYRSMKKKVPKWFSDSIDGI